jgi:hypothetical protein
VNFPQTPSLPFSFSRWLSEDLTATKDPHRLSHVPKVMTQFTLKMKTWNQAQFSVTTTWSTTLRERN